MARMSSDKVFRAWEIRNLMYAELNRLKHWKNEHLNGEGHIKDGFCRGCEMFDRIMQGVRDCIRLFGGRPRY